MSIGATINFSIPTVGTTVDTLNKIRESLFRDTISVGGVDVPVTLQLRASGQGTLQRRFGGVWKFSPYVLDAPSLTTKGRITVSINVDAQLGTEITDAKLADHVRYALSTFLKATLIESLRDGDLT